MPPWYTNWFNNEYLQIYAHRDEQEAVAQLRLLSSVARLDTSSRVLDIACGNGRHAFGLAEISGHVVGLDLSPELLEVATSRKRNLEAGSAVTKNLSFVRADMRYLPFEGLSFDFLTSFFTSFGYFETDQEHELLLREWARVLRPGGGLFMDYLNREEVIAKLQRESLRETENFLVQERRSITADGSRVEKEILLTRKSDNTSKRHKESVRMYQAEELSNMLERAGLRVRSLMGSTKGESFLSNSPRLIIFALKNG